MSRIGIRFALGAHSSDIKRMIVCQGLYPVVAGLVVGLAATLATGHLIRELLFGIEPWDLPSLFLTTGVVGFVSFAVILNQCRRSNFLDPAQLLRAQ